MTGYVATGRITRVHPRFVGGSAGSGRATAEATSVGVAEGRPAWVADTRTLDQRLADGWARAREEWAQATFFLFDPNSWR